MEHRWAVRESDGELLYGGAEPYDCVPGLSAGQVRLVFSARPDPRTQKCVVATGTLITKTPIEIAAYDDAQATAKASSEFQLALQAMAAALYKDVHGSFPNASQKTQLKADFVKAYKALG